MGYLRACWKCHEENFILFRGTKKGLFQKVNGKIENEKLSRIYLDLSQAVPANEFYCFSSLPVYFLPCFVLLSSFLPSLSHNSSLVFGISHKRIVIGIQSVCFFHSVLGIIWQWLEIFNWVCSCLVLRGFFSVSPHKTIFLCYFNLIFKDCSYLIFIRDPIHFGKWLNCLENGRESQLPKILWIFAFVALIVGGHSFWVCQFFALVPSIGSLATYYTGRFLFSINTKLVLCTVLAPGWLCKGDVSLKFSFLTCLLPGG